MQLLILSEQQLKVQKCSIYSDRKQRNQQILLTCLPPCMFSVDPHSSANLGEGKKKENVHPLLDIWFDHFNGLHHGSLNTETSHWLSTFMLTTSLWIWDPHTGLGLNCCIHYLPVLLHLYLSLCNLPVSQRQLLLHSRQFEERRSSFFHYAFPCLLRRA